MSPRKVRLVVNVVRGLSVTDAQNQLRFMNKAAAKPVLKLINSALANAEHNNNLKAENLFVETITADGGPTLKRFKPRAHGRATPIRKRTTHITVVLSDGKDDKVAKVSKTPKVSKEKKQKNEETKKESKKPAAEKPIKKTEKKEKKEKREKKAETKKSTK